VRRQEPHRGQVDRTLREQVEDHRKASSGAGDKALQPRDEIVIGKAGQGSEDIVLHTRL